MGFAGGVARRGAGAAARIGRLFSWGSADNLPQGIGRKAVLGFYVCKKHYITREGA